MSSEMWILEHSEPSARKLGPFTKTATQSHKHTIPAPKHSQHHGKGKSKQVEGERRDWKHRVMTAAVTAPGARRWPEGTCFAVGFAFPPGERKE